MTLALTVLGSSSCSSPASGQATPLSGSETQTTPKSFSTQVPELSRIPSQTEGLSFTVEATQTPAPTGIPTPSETPTVQLSSTATLEPALPEEYYITDISGHRQFFSLGCETSAAIDWAAYFGITINEYEFQYHLPLSDNPNYGFVGSVDGPWGQTPPYAYGVYAGPIADLLNNYGATAKAYKNYTLEQLKTKISQGIPVIAWVISNMTGGSSGNLCRYLRAGGSRCRL